MFDKECPAVTTLDLTQDIRKRIEQRTNGRVQMLEVERIGNRLLIRGFTMSFHMKQLAIQAVLDIITANPGDSFEMDVHITVIMPASDRDRGGDR